MARVVTAEDDEALLALITTILQRAGHTVLPCADADTALAQTRHHLPDLVLSDVDMPPGMTGVDLVAALQAEPATSHIPVMLVTGSMHPSMAQGDIRGVVDIVVKPFLAPDLLHRVDVALAQSNPPA